MMPILRKKFNYAWLNFEPGGRGGQVEVYLRNGRTRAVRWLGFIELNQARVMPGAKSVRLKVDRYTNREAPFDWETVHAGQYVQGCLIEEGVFAVVETKLKLVQTS